MPVPASLQSIHANGRYREDHASKSVLYLPCHSALCTQAGEPQEREYQIASIDIGKRVSVFRCVICDTRVEIDSDDLSKRS